MMSIDSTALIISEDDVHASDDDGYVEKKMPIMTRRDGSSASLPEVDSDTSNSVGQGPKIRSRVNHGQKKFPLERDRFEVLDNLEGVVTAVEGDSFFASMRHPSSKIERAEDEFEIYIDNVPEGDRDLVCVGAIFYLTIGIRRPRGESSQKTTQLVFRRMPRWSSRDIERAETATTDLWERLQNGLTTQTSEPYSEAK